MDGARRTRDPGEVQDNDEATSAPVSPWRARHERRGAGAAFLSPAVRRVLADSGLGAVDVRGTGTGGRVTRSDALAAARERPTAADGLEQFTAIRRTTAAHVARSRALAAHSHVAVLCDYGIVDRVRREHGLTALPFVARAVIDALRVFPRCNATSGDDELVVHREVHLGIAVDLDFEGLVVPVVHRAEEMRLRALAAAIADVAGAARARRLQPDQVAGGTFTITNPGPFGTFLSFPILNHPQVAILATDAVRKRVVVDETGDDTDALTIRPMGMLSLGFDHRVIDGAYAAAFLEHVADIVATRDWSGEL
jgi:2-oxoglutarate dehydrogenase E2 component (dihydrolipoamide succinyltransferase)